jgi:hypothetical protein
MDGLKLLPDPLKKHPYVLRNLNGWESQRDIEQAQAIVNNIILSRWYEDEMRTVEKLTGSRIYTAIAIATAVCLLAMVIALTVRF